MWNSGMTFRQRSPGTSSSERAMLRAEAATLSYHLHDTDYQIKVLDDDGRPGSHFELNHALDEAARGPFLIMTGPDGQLPKRFANAKGPIGASQVPISETRTRHKLFFISQ